MSKKRQGSNFTVGDISNSTGIAIGPGARASVNQRSTVNAAEVIAMLDNLARKVDVYAASLEDAADIQESLLDARSEASRATPRWYRVREVLEHVQPFLAGAKALSDIVDNIRALVGHG
jgi:hypothetical protein